MHALQLLVSTFLTHLQGAQCKIVEKVVLGCGVALGCAGLIGTISMWGGYQRTIKTYLSVPAHIE